jgi:serine protease Do
MFSLHSKRGRGVVASVIAAAVLVSPISGLQVQARADDGTAAALALSSAFSRVAEQFRPMVVSITSKKTVREAMPQQQFYFGDPFEEFFEQYFNGQGMPQQQPRQAPRYREHMMQSGGTGVIVNSEGYVLTNYHVIDDADDITVTLVGVNDKDETLPATVVGRDPMTDLAVIKINAKRTFPAAKLGDSDVLKVGDWVIAIGSPFGLEQTVTTGIVSARRQSLDIEDKRYENLIQTDAAINRGNSGGPLVNLKGEVIGINTAIYAPTGVFSGIGFAIPSNKATEILNDLIQKGKVSRGWLGVEIQNVDETIAQQFGLKDKAGVLVNNVVKNSAAERAGIKRGDIIVEANGTKIADSSGLQKMVRSTTPGKKIAMTVMRNHAPVTAEVVLAEMPETANLTAPATTDEKEINASWQGITVVPLTKAIAQRYGVNDEELGVLDQHRREQAGYGHTRWRYYQRY